MRKHIRVDTVKIFEEDERILKQIMQKEDLNKSAAWRFALKNYADYHATNIELADLKDMVVEMNEALKQMYFKMEYITDSRKDTI